MSRNSNRHIFGNVACRLLPAMLADECAETAKIDMLPGNYGTTDLFHKFLDNNRNGCGLDARFLGELLYDICFGHFCKFLSDKDKQTSELKKAHRQSDDYTNRFIVLPQNGAS